MKKVRDGQKYSPQITTCLKVGSPGQLLADTNIVNTSGLRRLALLICLAGACLCFYALLIALASHPCWYSIRCAKNLVSQRLGIMGAYPAARNYRPRDLPSPGRASAAKTRFTRTNLSHIVFGIAASSKLWRNRSNYIKLWWRPHSMRGYVWLDRNTTDVMKDNDLLPAVMISPNTSHFKYTNKLGRRSAIRISRIVSDTFRLGLPDVRWFVMGDDDTVFIPENLQQLLAKYDHRQYYYIGSNSESHLQNLMFSYNMAYGGGGFAISYPLAKALEKMQDGCLERYPFLFGSDDRIQACMAELGVPLTKEPGFHQYDIYGNLLGLIAAHPVTPAVSLHHLDVVEPVFPNKTRLDALQHLHKSIAVDPAGFLQQSICYDSNNKWSISVSWGFVVQVYRGIFSARELEMPQRTFYNWHKKADYTAYSFNTRPFARHPCQKPLVFYMQNVSFLNGSTRWTESVYRRHDMQPQECNWKMASPATVQLVRVVKRKYDSMWNKGPRRKCCRVAENTSNTTLHIDVRDCGRGEIASA